MICGFGLPDPNIALHKYLKEWNDEMAADAPPKRPYVCQLIVSNCKTDRTKLGNIRRSVEWP
jgi:hypothetical protein